MNCAIFALKIVGDFIVTASCFTVQGTLHRSVQFLKYYLPETQQTSYMFLNHSFPAE